MPSKRALRESVAVRLPGWNAAAALVGPVESGEPYMRGHSRRVALMAALIGEALQLSLEDLRTLHQSALMHDIGKIGVPDTILNKPERLTDDEFLVVKSHPVRGEAIARAFPHLANALPGIRSHHERWDGSGYPDGLVGDAIPLQGRIIAIADVFDAMTSSRAYRGAHDLRTVLGELRRGAGVRYDRQVVEAFFQAEVWLRVRPWEPA